MPEINVATLNAQARQAYDGEEFLEAAELFCQAAQLLQSDQPLEAGEALNNASVAYLRANKPQKALEKASGTEKLFHDAGDTRREAMAYGNLAAAYQERKDTVQALAYYQTSAELLKDIGEKDLRAYVLERISAIQLKQGKRIDALITMEAAIDSKSRLSFKDHLLRRLIRIVRSLLGQK
jgi:tetratricopeptide (TPR) repeat protein